jgi:hypothetical protein
MEGAANLILVGSVAERPIAPVLTGTSVETGDGADRYICCVRGFESHHYCGTVTITVRTLDHA